MKLKVGDLVLIKVSIHSQFYNKGVVFYVDNMIHYVGLYKKKCTFDYLTKIVTVEEFDAWVQ